MAGRRLALIVATDEYQDPSFAKLRAPGADAEALASVLRDPELGDFEVDVIRNETHWKIGQRVEALLTEGRLDDLIVLHFSCHGLKDDSGELYLAATNTQPNLLATTAVDASLVNRLIQRSRSQRVVLFLDCCYGGAFERGAVAKAGATVDVSDRFQPNQALGGGRGRVVITASNAMEFSFEGSDLTKLGTQPSIFTGALVEGLRSGDADRDQDGLFSLGEVYDYVFERVRQETPNQTPGKWEFGVQGEFILAKNPQQVLVPAPLPPDVAGLIDHPFSPTRLGSVDVLRRIAQGTNLQVAATAWAALGHLALDDSKSVAEAATIAADASSLRLTESQVDFGDVAVGAEAVKEVTIEGPPLAVLARVTASNPALRARRTDRTVRIDADTSDPGALEGVVIVESPAGKAEISVTGRVTATAVTREPEPVVAKPEPVVAKPEPVVAKPEPVVTKPEPVVAKPEPVVAKPEPVVTKPTDDPRPKPVPWWDPSKWRSNRVPAVGAGIVAVLVVAVGAYALLSGGGGPGASASPGTGGTPSGAASAEPGVSIVPVAPLSGSLTVWQPYDTRSETQKQAFATIVGRVQEANPDLKLTIEPVSLGVMFDTFDKAFADGTGPDVFVGTDDFIAREVAAGRLADITEQLDGNLDGVRDAAITGSQVDGRSYFVPESAAGIVMYYNRSEVSTPPATTDDLVAGMENKDLRVGIGQSLYHAFGWGNAFGGELIDESGNCVGDPAGVVGAFSFIKTLQADGATWYTKKTELTGDFTSGKTNLILDKSELATDYLGALGDDLGVAPMPAGPNGPATPVLGMYGWFVSAATKDPDLAAAFALAMVEPDNVQLFVEEAGHVPINDSVSVSDVGQALRSAMENEVPRPQNPAFWSAFQLGLNHVLDGTRTPEQAVAEACAQVSEAN